MAGAVGAGVGVVSTIAGMGEQSRQRNIASQQARVQQYTQEVQYEQEKMSIKQQKEYAAQSRKIEDIQLYAQDMQNRNALNDQMLAADQEQKSLEYQVAMKELQDRGALDGAKQQEVIARYGLGEQERQRIAQADSRQQETVGQLSQQQQQVAKFLSEGKQSQAAALLMNATQGQQDSVTSDNQTMGTKEIADTLRALSESGGLTEESIRQALSEKSVAEALKQAGLYDVALQSIGGQAQFDVNQSTTATQRALLATGKRKQDIGSQLATNTLEGGVTMRDQQRNIDKQFSNMGYQSQVDNAGVRNAAAMTAVQAQQAASKGSLFTTLANTAAIGGSLFNAYQQVKPVPRYSSPVYTPQSSGVSSNPPSIDAAGKGVLQDYIGNNYG
jgi:hypothetical protein